MKSKLIFGLLVAAIILTTSCDTETIRVSDTISTREYSLTDYNALEVSGDFDVFVTFSNTEESIKIEANDNLQDKIIVSKQDNTLKIRLENNLNIKGNARLNAYIKTSSISSYNASGDSSIELENLLVANNVSIKLSGNSRFHSELDTARLVVDIDGNSTIDMYGIVDLMSADLSGDSTLKDYDMAVEDLILKLSGDSEAFVSVSNTIDIEASGDSELNYRGNAEIIRQNLTGDSKIKKRD